jgi:DUF4097 and DUF4098 domain-containing protein YvlB
MANGRVRSSNLFSGLIIILIGVLLLMHNYRGFDMGRVFFHWWPALLIFWGVIKIYERTGARSGDPGAARITAGEVFLVLGLLALVGVVAATDEIPKRFPGWSTDFGTTTSEPLDVAPKPVQPNSRITIRTIRGDITVRTSDEPEIRVSGKAEGHGWSDSEARRNSEHVSVEVVKNGDGYEVRPAGIAGKEGRVTVDMDVVVPAKASVAARTDKGDISVSDLGTPVTITDPNGDVEVRNTDGDVSIDMHHGDAKVSDTRGNVKISGNGDSIEVIHAEGSLTLNGEFVGPIRADKIAKGVRFVSHRTDLTLTQLGGHMEAGSGNLEVVDAPGNLILRTHDDDISIENVGGKVKIDNRNGNIEVRFSSPPKEDIEITNASADITLSLPESSSFEISADCRSCNEDKGIDSEFSAESLKKTAVNSRDIQLQGTYGRGRGPKIILKTTYGSIAMHKTS